jgi:hypothetical protein
MLEGVTMVKHMSDDDLDKMQEDIKDTCNNFAEKEAKLVNQLVVDAIKCNKENVITGSYADLDSVFDEAKEQLEQKLSKLQLDKPKRGFIDFYKYFYTWHANNMCELDYIENLTFTKMKYMLFLAQCYYVYYTGNLLFKEPIILASNHEIKFPALEEYAKHNIPNMRELIVTPTEDFSVEEILISKWDVATTNIMNTVFFETSTYNSARLQHTINHLQYSYWHDKVNYNKEIPVSIMYNIVREWKKVNTNEFY